MQRKAMAGLLTAMFLAVAGQKAGAETDFPDLEIEIGLRDALRYTDGDAERKSLLFEVARYGDRWGRLWGVARNFNVGIHPGRVESATISGDTIEMKLAFKIEGDAWVPGGRAEYTLKAKQKKDGTLEGTFTGTFSGMPVNGEVVGKLKPAVKKPEGFVPVAPGEHPRILFRKSDLPALREKAKTPLGERALKAMGSPEGGGGDGDAIGMGVKYQITGDKKYAEDAKASVQKHMANMTGGALAIGRAWAGRQEQVAIAYDLCYDAWTPEFRKEVESYLRWITYRCFYDQSKISRTFNWNVQSNYGGPVLAGSAHAGLALWGEKGPEPAKPQPPAAVLDIAAAADYKVPAGVPVVPLEPGKSPNKWLATQPLNIQINADPMLSLDGMEKLRPEPGTKFTIDDNEVEFQPLAAEHILDKGGISLKNGLKKEKSVTLFFYTVLDNPSPQKLKVRIPFSRSGRTQMVLNGVRVAHEQVVNLDKGLYPMVVALRLGAVWGSLEPWLDPATEADIEASKKLVESQKADYELALKDWEFDMAQYQRLGGADIGAVKLMEMSRRIMYVFARDAVGTGGYASESGGYFNETLTQGSPAGYAVAYRKMFGRDLSSFDDMAAILPRLLMQDVYTADGKVRTQSISNKVHFDAEKCALLYPIVPEKYKPAVLWAWRKESGGSAENPDLQKLGGIFPVHTFINYPIDGKAVEPAKMMPLTWQAPGFGHYTFRNGWKGNEDVVFQAYAKEKEPGGWGGPDAGTFRLQGLGHVWAAGNTEREVRRGLENVVYLPENPDLTLSKLGRTTHSWFEADGSGGVTINLDDLGYNSLDKVNQPKYDRYGDFRTPAKGKPLVSQTRSMAVDYSGLSGAPVLLVIVDKMEGGDEKKWLWQVPAVEAAKATEKGFTMAQGDATLNATFVSPAKIKSVASAEGIVTKKSAGSNAGSQIVINTKAVRVSGEDKKDGNFFAVITLQKGEAPKVESTGSGLDSTVTVGQRVIKFDGEKIVFSKR